MLDRSHLTFHTQTRNHTLTSWKFFVFLFKSSCVEHSYSYKRLGKRICTGVFLATPPVTGVALYPGLFSRVVHSLNTAHSVANRWTIDIGIFHDDMRECLGDIRNYVTRGNLSSVVLCRRITPEAGVTTGVVRSWRWTCRWSQLLLGMVYLTPFFLSVAKFRKHWFRSSTPRWPCFMLIYQWFITKVSGVEIPLALWTPFYNHGGWRLALDLPVTTTSFAPWKLLHIYGVAREWNGR